MPDEKKPPEQKIKVRNTLAPEEDSVASFGDLEPIEFVKGIAEMNEDDARALHHASPHFELVEEVTPSARTSTGVASGDGAEKGSVVGNGSSS